MVKVADAVIAYMGSGPRTTTVNDERDEETGKFTSKHSPEDFVEALDDLGGAGGTTDVAEIVDCPERTAYYHLSNLREEGWITSRSVGASNLWMLADE
jgi:hypothetical protein